MFAISILRRSPGESRADAELVSGDVWEEFDVGCEVWDETQFAEQWRTALGRLIEQRVPVALLADMPKDALASGAVLPAWVCYPEGERVYLQFREFVVGEHAIKIEPDGQVVGLEARETFTDYGLPIAEIVSSVEDVRAFLSLGVAR